MNVPHIFSAADDVWSIRTTGSWALAVNAYVVRSEGATALIDTGFPSATETLLAGLSAVGVDPSSLDAVLYTHTHPDHMGGGIAAGSALGGDHVFWRGTEPARVDYNQFYASLPTWRGWLSELLPEGETRDAVLSLFPPRAPAEGWGDGTLPRPRPVEFGDVVEVGALRLECIDGRGHDPYHVGWLDRRRGWLFSGDVVLPKPTPLLPILFDDLPRYRATVHRWAAELEVSRLFPGHGRPTNEFAGAVAASCGHTRALYESVRELLERGSVDVSEFVRDARADEPGTLRRSFVTLGAVASQLTELETRGLVRRRDDRRWERVCALPDFEHVLSS